MPDGNSATEHFERTRSTARETRGGTGCCGCCAGALLLGGLAALLGFSQLLGWIRESLAELDTGQGVALVVIIVLALSVLIFVAWRMRPRMRRTTTIVTRVSRRKAPREQGENRPPSLDEPLDAPWRPVEAPDEEARAED